MTFASAPSAGCPAASRHVHRRRLLLAILGALLLGLAPAGGSQVVAVERVVSLREVLSPDEFRRAGLDKLTPEELAFLSARLLGGRAAVVPSRTTAVPSRADQATALVPRGESAFGREEQVQAQVEKVQAVPREIRSRIAGRFDGWSGHTVFRLTNGQVWKQIEPAEFAVNLASPAVSIRKGLFGTFFLSVEGYGPQVKVKRVK